MINLSRAIAGLSDNTTGMFFDWTITGNWSWQGGAYQLFPWKGYVLKSGDRALFHGDSAL